MEVQFGTGVPMPNHGRRSPTISAHRSTIDMERKSFKIKTARATVGALFKGRWGQWADKRCSLIG